MQSQKIHRVRKKVPVVTTALLQGLKSSTLHYKEFLAEMQKMAIDFFSMALSNNDSVSGPSTYLGPAIEKTQKRHSIYVPRNDNSMLVAFKGAHLGVPEPSPLGACCDMLRWVLAVAGRPGGSKLVGICPKDGPYA